MASKRAKRFWIIAGIVIVVGGLWAAAFAIGGLSDAFSSAYSGSGDYDEVVIEEGESGNKIVMINVVGEIFSDPDGITAGASDTNILKQLELAREDPDVVGIILNVDTPGGGVVASDKIYNEVREINEDIPVLALMGDTAASGGYYISAGASEIIAHPLTWTGSIGVIAMLPNLTEAADKLGISVTIVKSGEFKDIGSPLRPLSPEEQALLQGLIDEAYNRFVEVVADGRELPENRVRELADGRIYSGNQAEELGLVDRLGDRDTAFERARELADDEDAALVQYQPVRGLFDEIPFFGFSSPVDDVKEELGIPRRPGAAYLWLP